MAQHGLSREIQSETPRASAAFVARGEICEAGVVAIALKFAELGLVKPTPPA
ncbi:hypothetical protein ACVIJ6_000220 [Bradyrhizobium sp. USDA 4369]